MFFFFSKILEFFIYPFSWILILSAAALIVKKQQLKRRLLITSFALLLIFSDTFLINQFARLWDIKPAPLNQKTYSCAIVLGGFSNQGSGDDGYFNASADRFIQGLKLWNTGKVSHILISGGNGSLIPNKFSESVWVKTQLKLFKVPDSCILIESRSRNTLENAAFSKTVLQQNHLQPPYLLVTSAFHMRRAMGIFKAEQVDITPFPCNYVAGGNSFVICDLVPDGGTFGTWNLYVKEVIGTMVNHLKR